MNYYQTLGVEENATQEQIEKAYRKLAIKWHPDHHPDESKEEAQKRFAEINQAYEILGDADKRRRYEQPSMFGFESFFDMFRGHRGGGIDGNHVVVDCDISLEEAATGTVKEVLYPKAELCDLCDGKGGEMSRCERCDGKGFEDIHGENAHVRRGCRTCGGRGESMKKSCGCDSGYKEPVDHKVKVQVPPGIFSGMNMTFRGMGMPGVAGGRQGDLLVKFNIKEHDRFSRQKENLYTDVPITYTELVFGTEKEVTSLYGDKLSLKVPAGTEADCKFRMKGHGMPVLNTRERGSLYVSLKLKILKDFDEETLQLLQKLSEREA